MVKKKSRKLSSTTTEPHDYTFFTDRDLGKIFPSVLRNSGLKVEIHDDHFNEGTSDAEWLDEVGKRDWIAITHDRSLRYESTHTQALMEAGTRTFVVIGHAPFSELAHNFIRTHHKIEKFLIHNEGPFIAKVFRPPPNKSSNPGRVTMWLSYKDWKAHNKSR